MRTEGGLSPLPKSLGASRELTAHYAFAHFRRSQCLPRQPASFEFGYTLRIYFLSQEVAR